MDPREEVYQAIRVADKAGRRDDVLKLSAYLDTLGASSQQVKRQPDAPPGEIPVDTSLRAPPATARKAEEEPSLMLQGRVINSLLGAGETALSAVTAIPAAVYGGLAGVSTALRSGKYGTAEGANIAEQAAAQSIAANAYQPRTETGKRYLEGVGNALQDLVPIAGLTGEMSALARTAKPALSQGRGVAGRVVDAAKPNLDPEVIKLAKTAEKYGIPLRPDMLGDNKFAKVFGNFAERDVPLSGSRAQERTASFNNAIIKQIGGDDTAGKLTPDVYVNAMDKNGSTIGRIAAATTIDDASGLIGELDNIVNSSMDYGATVHGLVAARARDFKSLVRDGRVDGKAFQKWNTKMLQDIRAADDVTQTNLSALQDAAMNTFESYISPDVLPDWKQARQQYAIGKQLIPLVAESPTGDISPSRLMTVVANRSSGGAERMAYGQGGDLGELAKIGRQFLGEPTISSIPERATTYGLLGLGGFGAGGVAGTIGAGAVYGGSTLYNRLAPGMVRGMTNRLPKQAPVSEPWTTSKGFPPPPERLQLNPLGDITPDWSTSRGAGVAASRGGVDASGLYPAAGERPLVPPRGMAVTDYKPNPLSQMPGVDFSAEPALAGLVPEWTTTRGFDPRATGVSGNALYQAALDDPSVMSRTKGRPQMPVVPGRPGLADVAISGGKWTDAEVGAAQRLLERPATTAKEIRPLLEKAGAKTTGMSFAEMRKQLKAIIAAEEKKAKQ